MSVLFTMFFTINGLSESPCLNTLNCIIFDMADCVTVRSTSKIRLAPISSSVELSVMTFTGVTASSRPYTAHSTVSSCAAIDTASPCTKCAFRRLEAIVSTGSKSETVTLCFVLNSLYLLCRMGITNYCRDAPP